MSWVVFVFGFVSVFRILKSYSEKKFLSANLLTKIGTLYLLSSFTLSSLSKTPLIVDVFIQIFLVILVASFPLFLVLSRERRFEEYIIERMDLVVLNMNLGESFKSAFEALIRLENEGKFKSLTTKLYRAVTFPQQAKGSFYLHQINDFVTELRFINSLEHGSIDALKNLQHHQKLISGFRRKSGKAKAQVLLQAWILSGIQAALGFYMTYLFGIESTFSYLLISALLVVIGHIISWRFGRRVKWRV